MTAAPAQFLPYGRQHIEDDDIAAVVEVLRGDWLTTGPTVAAFEAALCAATGAAPALACARGTAALHHVAPGPGLDPGPREHRVEGKGLDVREGHRCGSNPKTKKNKYHL